MPAYNIVVPAGAHSGDVFQARVNGQLQSVRVPAGAGPGTTIQINVAAPTGQYIQMIVPAGAVPGQQIQANVGGQMVRVAVPPGATPGSRMTVMVPGGGASPPMQTAAAQPAARKSSASERQSSAAARPSVASRDSTLRREPTRPSFMDDYDLGPPEDDDWKKSARTPCPPARPPIPALHHPRTACAAGAVVRDTRQSQQKAPVHSYAPAQQSREISALWWLNMGI